MQFPNEVVLLRGPQQFSVSAVVKKLSRVVNNPASPIHTTLPLRLELHLAGIGKSPAIESGLIVEDELDIHSPIFPHLGPTAVADPREALVVDLIWFAQPKQDLASIG